MRYDPVIVRDLADLVAIPSLTGDEYGMRDELAGRLEALGLRVETLDVDPGTLANDDRFPGMEVERDRLPLVAGHLTGSRPGPRILLVGHIDVVPPGEPSTWTSAPFEPRVEDGRLYGRGACDMKGGIVSILSCLRALMPDASRLAGEVLALFVPSEEDGGAGAFAAIRNGYTGDAAVITEPTGLDVVVAHAGAITFTLDVPGKAAHASRRLDGVSALDNLYYLCGALAEDESWRNESEADPLMAALDLPYPTMIGRVEGGVWPSSVMDRVVAHGRYGVRLGQTAGDAEGDLRRAIDRAARLDPFLSGHPPTVTVWGGRFDSARVDPGGEPVTGLTAAAREVGIAPSPVGVPYGADMRLFVNEGATPTVMFGPGSVRHAHAADEFVPLDEVEACGRVLARWIAGMAGGSR